MAGQEIRTADGETARLGDRLFNYYDMKWGVIENFDLCSPGWFGFRHDDGTYATLNGERVAAEKPAWMKEA